MSSTTAALLSTTYFGPIQWYQKLSRYQHVQIEMHESFIKQTYRNRCLIATTQGVQALTIPIEHPVITHLNDCYPPSPEACKTETCNTNRSVRNTQCATSNVLLSDHGNWRHLHWQALQSAYGDSPFFEYYEDDLRPFFTERNWERLFDYNEAIWCKMCELLDIHPQISLTESYQKTGNFNDFREAIRPKHPLPDADFSPRPYYQVFSQKHGFLPNLSILDLLFNMGRESIFYL